MKKRIEYFDGLRVIACLMVITIHVFGIIAAYYSHSTPSTRALDAIAVSFSRSGVSLFFMISGALMLSSAKNQSISYVFKYRFLKIIKLLLIGGTLYLIGEFFYNHRENLSINEFINGYTNNEFSMVLWFLYILAGLYLCLPLLMALKEKSDKYIIYLIILVFFNVYVRELLGYLFHIELKFEVPMATSFLGVFLIGYLLSKWELSKQMTKSLMILGLAALIIMIFFTFIKSVASNKLVTDLWENYNLLTLFMSTGIFAFAKESQKFRQFSKNKLIIKLSDLTLIVYIIHVFVLNVLLKRIFMWDVAKMQTENYVSLWILTVVISFIVAILLQKITVLIKSKYAKIRSHGRYLENTYVE